MRILRGHTRHQSYVVVFICLGFLTFLSACGGSGGGSEGNCSLDFPISKTGSIVLDLEWEVPPEAPPEALLAAGNSFTAQLSSRDVCADYGIEEVGALVRDKHGTLIASETWPCSAHSGTIEEVPAGTGISILVDGLISEAPMWRKEIQNLAVVAGETTIIPKVLMVYRGDDTDPPAVFPITPLDKATEVPRGVVIKGEFNEDMVQSTINQKPVPCRKKRQAERYLAVYRLMTRIQIHSP